MIRIWVLSFLALSFAQLPSSLDSLKIEIGKGKDASPFLFIALAEAYSSNQQLDSAIITYTHAIEKGQMDTSLLVKAYGGLGTAYYKMARLDDAIDSYLQAAKISERQGDSLEIGKAYNNVAMVLNLNGQNEKSLEYYRKAIKISRLLNDPMDELPKLVNIGVLFKSEAQYDSAIFYGELALSSAEKLNSMVGVGRAILILAESYINNGEAEKGLQMARRGETVFSDLDYEQGYQSMIYLQSLALFKLGNYEAASQLIDTLVSRLEEGEHLKEESFFLQYEVKKKIGKSGEALLALENYTEAYKRYFENDRDKKIAELETKYENEKQKNTISRLEQAAALAKAREERRNTIWLASFIVLVVLILAGIFWFQRRIAVKNALALEANQKFLRSRINPHFLFNALTSIRSYLYEEKNNGLVIRYISNFASLMRKFLEHSGIENISLQEELDALSTYIDLQKLRFNHSFDVVVNITDEVEIENILIPSLLLQPYIENAIEHGVANEKEGRVEISISRKNETLNISIVDNGSERGNSQRESLSSGIQQRRMTYFNQGKKRRYAVAQRVLLDVNDNKIGYEVIVQIPILEK